MKFIETEVEGKVLRSIVLSEMENEAGFRQIVKGKIFQAYDEMEDFADGDKVCEIDGEKGVFINLQNLFEHDAPEVLKLEMEGKDPIFIVSGCIDGHASMYVLTEYKG